MWYSYPGTARNARNTRETYVAEKRSIEDKIAALLRKAESTTPEEAKTLTAHAEKLMLKYSIDKLSIDAKRAVSGKSVADEPIVREYVMFTSIYAQHVVSNAARCVDAFGVTRSLFITGSGWAELMIYGRADDVAQVKLIITSLNLQAVAALSRWWKENRHYYAFSPKFDGYKARRSFLQSFFNGAAYRILQSHRQVIEESNEPGTALAIRSLADRLTNFIDAKNPTKHRDRTSGGDRWAANDGFAAGRQANVGDPQVKKTDELTA